MTDHLCLMDAGNIRRAVDGMLVLRVKERNGDIGKERKRPRQAVGLLAFRSSY